MQQVDVLTIILATRFDTLPDEISNALAHCTLDQLQDLINPALDAPDLNTFLTHTPKSDTGAGSGSAENDRDQDGGTEADDLSAD